MAPTDECKAASIRYRTIVIVRYAKGRLQRRKRWLDRVCPICGHTTYIKTMPLHLSGHKPDDPDVIAWRNARRVAREAIKRGE